ncbi:hypothetical protein K443DRAFT_112679, partial [Laccaria amethystina LaAM-08-1]
SRGHATIGGDGRTLIVSNLVDTYSIPPCEPLQTFRHPIHHNVPLVVSAVPGSSLFVVGSDDGCPRIYDQRTGHHCLSWTYVFPFKYINCIFICSQAITGDDDFVIVTGSSSGDDVQIKIWTPIKDITQPISAPPPVAVQGGISLMQMCIIIVICVLVQALLLYTPMDKVTELLSKVQLPNYNVA